MDFKRVSAAISFLADVSPSSVITKYAAVSTALSVCVNAVPYAIVQAFAAVYDAVHELGFFKSTVLLDIGSSGTA